MWQFFLKIYFHLDSSCIGHLYINSTSRNVSTDRIYKKLPTSFSTYLELIYRLNLCCTRNKVTENLILYNFYKHTLYKKVVVSFKVTVKYILSTNCGAYL